MSRPMGRFKLLALLELVELPELGGLPEIGGSPSFGGFHPAWGLPMMSQPDLDESCSVTAKYVYVQSTDSRD